MSLQKSLKKSLPFYAFLNRCLFIGSEPRYSFKAFQSFYGHSQSLVDRFYSDRMRKRDYVRFFMTRPPISPARAFRVLREASIE